MKYDVIIVGGGVLGISLAYHLGTASRGSGPAPSVLLIEREPMLAVHASGRNAGMFRKLYRHPQLTEWAHRSQQLWPQALREDSFRETGSLIAGRHLPSHHRELFAEQSAALDGGEPVNGVYCRTDGLLDSPHYVETLRTMLNRDRIQLRLGEAVQFADRTGRDWRIQTRSGFTAEAPWLVNAAGAWINSLLAPNLSVEALPYARHLFLTEGWPENFMPHTQSGFFWDERSGWYMRQWERHTRLVSSCDKLAVLPEEYTPPPQLREQLAETLTAALPQSSQHVGVVRQWHCFRTYTPDQLPIWGIDPRAPGLFWLAAFGGFGMSTSFAAAADAAAVLLGKESRDLVDFSPTRVSCPVAPLHDGSRVAA